MGNYRAGKGKRHIVIYHEGQRSDWTKTMTKAEADQFEAEQRRELQRQTENPNHRSVVPFSEVFQEYSKHAVTHLAETTWNKVRVYQVATLTEFFGCHNIDRLSTVLVDSYKRLRLKGAGVVSINNELRIFRAINNWGRDAGYPIPECKWKFLPDPGEDYVKVWTHQELNKLFQTAYDADPKLLPIMVFLLNTGLRPGEVLAAERPWVDVKKRMLTVPVNDYWKPKNRKPRQVPLSDAALEVIENDCHHPTILFPNKKGTRFVVWPKDRFWDLLESSGLEGHPHMFRHTYASNFLMTQPDMYLLSQVLGHSHERITKIYTHLLPGHLDRAMNAVNFRPDLVKDLVKEVDEANKKK